MTRWVRRCSPSARHPASTGGPWVPWSLSVGARHRSRRGPSTSMAPIRVGAMLVDGPRLDLWRAPTDNDHGTHGPPVEAGWRALGLHRLTHRVIDRQCQGSTAG